MWKEVLVKNTAMDEDSIYAVEIAPYSDDSDDLIPGPMILVTILPQKSAVIQLPPVFVKYGSMLVEVYFIQRVDLTEYLEKRDTIPKFKVASVFVPIDKQPASGRFQYAVDASGLTRVYDDA